MGTNTLETAYSNGQIIDASHVNEITASIINQFVGRNTSGVPEAGKSLGTAAIPWGTVHANSVVLDGQAVDTSKITSLANRIVSGATRADSDQPDFLRADGAAASLTVLGAATNLTLSINAQATTVSTDIVKTGLSLAPTTNNTVDVNMSGLSGDLYTGEDEVDLIVDNMGTEIVDKIGEYVALQTPAGEIMYAFVKDSTTLANVFRGFFFDDGGAPVVRAALADNDTLTLLSTGYVFIEDNGTTVDISYTQPTYSFEAPAGPTTGQYWFDIPNQTWKRYSGTEFEIINRILVGVVVMDDTNAIVQRSADFTNSFSDINNVSLEIVSTEQVASKKLSTRVNVYGTEIIQDLNALNWNITTDLEGGVSESSDTVYYLYLSNKGERIISDIKPYERKDLKGDYHPYQSWRLVGMAYNNSGNDFSVIWDENTPVYERALVNSGAFTTSSLTFVDVTNQEIAVLLRKTTRLSLSMAADEDSWVSGTFNGFYATASNTNQQSEYAYNVNGSDIVGRMYFESVGSGIAILHGPATCDAEAALGGGLQTIKFRARKVSAPNQFHEVRSMRLEAREVENEKTIN